MVFTHRPLVLERWELVAKFPTLKYASFWPTERQECLTLKHALPTHIKSGCGSLTMTNKVLKKRYKWDHKLFYCYFVINDFVFTIKKQAHWARSNHFGGVMIFDFDEDF